MTNLRGASPDSWSEMGSARGSQHGGLMDTATIRQAVFDEWRTKKSERLKEQLASKSAEKKKLEEKEKEERERKKMVNSSNCVPVFRFSLFIHRCWNFFHSKLMKHVNNYNLSYFTHSKS